MRIIFALVAIVALQSAANAQAQQAKSADAFVDSIGTVTHMSYLDTPYGNYDAIKARFQEIGIRHIRDGLSNAESIRRLKLLYTDAKVRLTAGLFDGGWQGTTADLQDWKAKAISMGAALEAVEGSNEISEPYNPSLPKFTYNGVAFPQGAFALQRDLYNLVKGDNALKQLPIIQMSLAAPIAGRDAPALAATSVGQYADYGNAHVYAPWGNPPGGEVSWFTNIARSVTPNKPMQVTETGYTTQITPTSCCSVTEAVHGRYIVRGIAENWRQDVTRAFLYEFIDTLPPGKPDTGYGLLRHDNTPRPAFTAVKSLIALLKDPGAPFTAGQLNYTLSFDNAKPIRSFLLQKRNRAFYIVLYNDSKSWDNDTKQQVTIPNVPVTLTVATPSRIKGASVYSYDANWTLKPTRLTITNGQATVSVSDKVTIIELKTATATPVGKKLGIRAR